ncbi:MAG: sulfite exporter TauE/SafE family protein [Phycisphaeraceae bacterium]
MLPDWLLPDIPPDTPLWLYIACAAGAVFIIGVAKAGFGGGIGVVAVPLMAVALPTDRTIGVILPVLIFADLFSVRHHRGNESRPHLRWLLVGAILGIIAGTLILWWWQTSGVLDFALNLAIGTMCLIFVAIQCYRLAGGHVPHISPRPIAGRIAGFLAGFVSTLTHAAGPVISIYLLEQRLAKKILVGTAVMFAFAGNLLKLPTYFGLQLIDPVTLIQSLWCLPLVPLGTWTGYWMHTRINEKAFTIIMYLGAAAAAAHMLYKAILQGAPAM